MQAFRASGAGSVAVLCLLLSCLSVRAEIGFMTLGVSTTAPIGHHLLCRDLPRECEAPGSDRLAPVDLTASLIQTVAEINTQTNAEIEPVSDQLLYGVEEHWVYPEDGRGDCEDFVLLKRQRLEAIGIPLSNLLITVVRKPNGEGHAVLTLRTSTGDFVLDNLDWRVRAWRDTPYAFVKRQSSEDPGKWLSIAANLDFVVGALGR
ncbi:MAG: transglutaminase-like cysteine peptidase [Rhizobiaceae bacterium]|nr:transglutaminase-like cysteine peptidase [Rhizobiaceae bacterium]